ncbi:hypothetical protein [Photobacterium minamisatsumaniensis]|uniref:hypothetical protein n=1 Tax=Photobacterium minamisatsumaniensis TaxID=2910233 RepID=UPI003D0B5836
MKLGRSNDFFPLLKWPLACLFAQTDEVIVIRPSNRPSNSKITCDLASQVQEEINLLKLELHKNGYQLSEIIQTEVRLSSLIPDEQLDEIYRLIEQLPGEIEVIVVACSSHQEYQDTGKEKLISIEAMVIH